MTVALTTMLQSLALGMPDSSSAWVLIIAAVIVLLILLLVGGRMTLGACGVRFIPNDRVGIIEKLWSAKGSVKEGRILAMNGEAGYEARVLRGQHLESAQRDVFHVADRRADQVEGGQAVSRG